MQKWAIISLLEAANEGSEFYYTDFPLHMTFAGVFAVNKSGKVLTDELIELLADKRQFEIQADTKAMFGLNEDIPVITIKKTDELSSLYLVIHEWLENSHAVYNSPQYQGAGYLPHSTVQKTSSLEPKERRLIKSVSLIDLFPNSDGYMRKIVKTIGLK